jgi:hypothetical protein
MSKFQAQIQLEKSHAKRELFTDVLDDIVGNEDFGFDAEVKYIGTALTNVALTKPAGWAELAGITAVMCRNTMVEYVLALVLSEGFSNLTPVQAIAAACVSRVQGVLRGLDEEASWKKSFRIAHELVIGVARTASSIRYITTDSGLYLSSTFQLEALDERVYEVAHPLPLSVKPKKVHTVEDSMYRSDTGYKVMLGSKHNLQEDMELPFESINTLSRVAYAVELASHDLRPLKDAKKGLSPAAQEAHQYNQVLHQSQSFGAVNSLVESGNKFYFAHSLDSRLRMYSKGYQLNLQGSEYDKSLIEFHRKEMLTQEGLDALYIAIANAYGKDKDIFVVRELWVLEHMDVLENFTDSADEPLLFAKMVRALRADERGEAVGVPVHFDATASGLQINGALLGCVDTLTMGNCIMPEGTDVRVDAYTVVFNILTGTDSNQSLVKRVYGEGAVLDTDALDFLMSMTRKEFKDAMVPAFYGSEKEPLDRLGEVIAPLFWQALQDTMKGAYWYLKMLPQLWRSNICEYTFTMPDGYKVYTPVLGSSTTREWSVMANAEVSFSEEVMCYKKKSKAFLAHITHSLDAYVMRNIVAKCEKYGLDIMCIHDSYGVHPNYVGFLQQWYKEEIAAIAAHPTLLQDILEEIFGHKVQVPAPDMPRDELAKLVLRSKYPLS